MKYIIVSMAMLMTTGAYSQTASNEIIGKWLKLPKEDLVIEVFQEGNVYNGTIQWSKDESDKKGFLILEKLEFDSTSNRWENGKISDPRTGKEYKAFATMNPDGNLEVHGYKGFKFMGVKRLFKRVP